jgi:hypothetical protein
MNNETHMNFTPLEIQNRRPRAVARRVGQRRQHGLRDDGRAAARGFAAAAPATADTDQG